jgi:hypothetical protein
MLPAPSSAQEAGPAAPIGEPQPPATVDQQPTTGEPQATGGAAEGPPTTTPATTTTPTPTANPGGVCPLPAAQAIEAALRRSDAGEAGADLDLAACWRVLEQPYPERVALARALARGLPAEQEEGARARLEALGGPPPVEATAAVPDEGVAGEPPDGGPRGSTAEGDGTAAYVLAGLSIAGLVAGTAIGLGALYEDSRAEREVVDDGLAVELGIAAGVCAGVGIAAGIAALVLWPEEETGPTAGPGEVGLGWEVRF